MAFESKGTSHYEAKDLEDIAQFFGELAQREINKAHAERSTKTKKYLEHQAAAVAYRDAAKVLRQTRIVTR